MVHVSQEHLGRATQVLIVDDHVMVAEGIAAFLEAQPDMEVVGVAGSGAEALLLVDRFHPDVVIMDFQLPDGDGGDVTRQIKKVQPSTAVIMLTGAGAGQALAKAISAGCAGFLMKGYQIRELAQAVRSVLRGELVIHAGMLDEALPLLLEAQNAPFNLTAREIEVLGELAAGTSTEALAESLVISRHTVRNYITNILTKLGAHSRLEAVAIAIREGVIAPSQNVTL
jgi:DNA-binding NarL/FixJ family response regulator